MSVSYHPWSTQVGRKVQGKIGGSRPSGSSLNAAGSTTATTAAAVVVESEF